ncbi:MAG: hypothetical protein M3R52_08865 [Acidobacteriota bacterium]|nr:hypothetical protein [Acidobacteriota bacterium]
MRKPGHFGRQLFGLIIGIIALSSAPAYAQGIITTVAGNGTRGFSGDGGLATNALLNMGEFTGGVAVDAASNLYIADTRNHRVRKVTSSGMISTVAGNVLAGFSGDGGPAISASLNSPAGVGIDAAGNLYIVDTGNQRIRKVNPNGTISTAAGNGVAGYAGDQGSATNASLHFNRYTGNCAIDSAGNLYIPDTENHSIRKVGTDGTITTVASVHWPYSVAADAAGAIYIGGEDGVIVKVNANGTRTDVAAGLNVPAGVALDRAGNLYIADSHNHRVRKADPNGVTKIIAGSGDPIFDIFDGYVFV